jgi:hypothetical protein
MTSEPHNERRLDEALTRAERALARIERVAGENRQRQSADEALRSRVRDAVAELDRIIGRAEV